MIFSLAMLVLFVTFLTPLPLPPWEAARKKSHEQGEGLPWFPNMSARRSCRSLANVMQKMQCLTLDGKVLLS